MSLLSNLLKPFLKQCVKSKANKNLPNYNQSIESEESTAPVEIIRDEWGVPHIYAQNKSDLFFAQGYVHAQERLWKMEFLRIAVDGTLSEILGEGTLEVDKLTRSLGLYKLVLGDKKDIKRKKYSL